MGNIFSQCFRIPAPTLTEKNLPDQSGKVFIVTGGNAGCGFNLSKILYQRNGTVYLAGRSAEKCKKAVEDIKKTFPDAKGSLTWLKLDLSDLTTIKKTADDFLAKETRLDCLFNNAGVMVPPKGSKTTQGYDLQVGTNCLGPLLLTHYLHPILKKTAASSPPNSVRVAWAGSLGIDLYAPAGGVTMNEKGEPILDGDIRSVYGVSKSGNLFLASEFSKRNPDDGIVHVCFNPGNLNTDLQRYVPGWQMALMSFVLFPAIFGAYTELWCGLSPDLTTAQNGSYIAPWGRVGAVKKDRQDSLKPKSEGGSGKAEMFYDWCESICRQYM